VSTFHVVLAVEWLFVLLISGVALTWRAGGRQDAWSAVAGARQPVSRSCANYLVVRSPPPSCGRVIARSHTIVFTRFCVLVIMRPIISSYHIITSQTCYGAAQWVLSSALQ